MLAPTDIPGYLLERRLLSPRAVVDGGFRVDDRSRRNAVFVVSAEGEPRYVLKIGADDGALAREAGVLAALAPLTRVARSRTVFRWLPHTTRPRAC